MGDNQNARLATALGRLLLQKDRSTLGNVLEDVFPVYLLDSLAAAENAYQQSRDWWWAIASGLGAAGQAGGVSLLNSSPGSLVVIEELWAASTAAQSVEVTWGSLLPGSAQAGVVTWGDERNGIAQGPPAIQTWTTTAAGAPTTAVLPLNAAGAMTKLPVAPLILRATFAASSALRVRGTALAQNVLVLARGYERPWEPSDA